MPLCWYRVHRLVRGLSRDGAPTLTSVLIGAVEAAHHAAALDHAVREFKLPRACLTVVRARKVPKVAA